MTTKVLFVYVLCITIVIAAVGGTVGSSVGLEEGFSAGLTAGLVFVTATYVYLHSETVRATQQSVQAANQQVTIANQQVAASNRQAEIMLNEQFNAAAPVIELNFVGKGPTTIGVVFENVGKGPALNFRCWIEDEQHPELCTVNKAICQTAVAVGQSNTMYIATQIQGYTLGIGYLRAQYESVFHKTYESRLYFPTNAAPELKYGEVVNDSDIVVL